MIGDSGLRRLVSVARRVRWAGFIELLSDDDKTQILDLLIDQDEQAVGAWVRGKIDQSPELAKAIHAHVRNCYVRINNSYEDVSRFSTKDLRRMMERIVMEAILPRGQRTFRIQQWGIDRILWMIQQREGQTGGQEPF